MTCADHQDEQERLGYGEWMNKAEASNRRGVKQRQCGECKRWYFPWEITVSGTAKDGGR